MEVPFIAGQIKMWPREMKIEKKMEPLVKETEVPLKQL